MPMNAERGFSLVELAMVMFIISLVLGGLLVPLATQMEARQRNDAEDQLERIKEALIGFALINGRLPCYTTTTDPASANYGVEDAVCNPTGIAADGILPWKTLGLTHGRDPWGVQRTAATDPWLGYWRYRVRDNFITAFTLDTPVTTNLLCVVEDLDGVGSYDLLVSTSQTPVAIIYSTGADQTADGYNTAYEASSISANCQSDAPILYQGGPASDTFDDLTTWITRPLLFNRMVTAGRLP